MPFAILGLKIEDRSSTRGLTRRWPDLQKQLLHETATHWHDEIFPRHFGPRNRSQYGFEPRRKFYLDVIKRIKGSGEGKFRDEVLTGKSRRWLQAFVKISGSAKSVTVRMKPPGYFTNPYIGPIHDPKTGKTKIVTRQPNKPDEVTRYSPEDTAEVRAFMNTRIVTLIKEHTPPPWMMVYSP